MSLGKELSTMRSKNLRQYIRRILQAICPDCLGFFPFFPEKENIFSPYVHIHRYDHHKKQCCLVYYTESEQKVEVFLGQNAAPMVAYKISSLPHTSPQAQTRWRHHFWVDLQHAQENLSVHSEGKMCSLSLQGSVLESVPHTAIQKAFALPAIPFYGKKYAHAWVLMDRAHVADDNAEHLYRYIQKHHPEQVIYFALQKNCSDWTRLQAENFNLIDVNSFHFRILLQYCQIIASSHMDIFHLENTWAHSHKMRKKHIYLRHGINMNDQSSWYNSPELSLDIFICTTYAEHAALTAEKSLCYLSTKEAQLLGLTRHDALVPHMKKHAQTLLIMPTWRRYLTTIHDTQILAQSSYVQHWNALLNSAHLQQFAVKHNLQIIFYLHNDIRKMRDVFSVPSHVDFASQGSKKIQDLFKEATLMITDYSSVFFEMGFLEKAVAHYQFDPEDFYGPHWAPSYYTYEEHGFGPVAATQEEILHALEKLTAQDQIPEPYLSRMQQSFAFKDGGNCARTYAALTDLLHPSPLLHPQY